MRVGLGQSRSRRRAAFALRAGLAYLALAFGGCRHQSALIDLPLPPLPALEDAAVEVDPAPPGSKPCTSDADCDDGVACTRDVCQKGHYCTNAELSSLCSDGVFCNGEEVCDPTMGCLPSTPPNCDDGDLCTIDACDDSMKACRHDPRDFDGDGEADWHCPGGTDCDDSDPNRNSHTSEVCGDNIDNDCDDKVDESDCVRADHDTCAQALDVSAGGFFQVSLAGALGDYALSCVDKQAPDVAFSFTLDSPKDVTLTATGQVNVGAGDDTATVAVFTNCADAGTARYCNQGFPGQVRVRALAAGTYYVVVASQMAYAVVLQAQFDPPTDPPTNTTCATPLDVSAGGRFEGSMVDAGNDETLDCGPTQPTPDLIYSFTLTETHDVEIDATSLDGGRMSFGLRSTCHDPSTTVRCVTDAPARAHLYSLAAGTYYIVLEGQASRLVDFALEVAFLDPSSPPAGDGCDNPLDLPIGMQVIGSLANREDLVDVQCRCDASQGKADCDKYLPDVVYRVHVDSATDLELSIDAGSALMIYAFRSSCDTQATQSACGSGTLIDGRVRDVVPGDYYVILESTAPSTSPASYTMQLDKLPRTVPMSVSGNDTCASAFDIPDGGGLFAGDTLNALDDYQASCGGGANSADAAYRLVLTQRSRVTATLTAPFDTVLYLYPDTGDGAASCTMKNELACNDDGTMGSSGSQLVEPLDAGTYYYIVDGFGQNNEGKYLFEVDAVPAQ